MNSFVFPCGCAIASSMFGEREIRQVALCEKHAQDEVIQKEMRALVAMLRELDQEEA